MAGNARMLATANDLATLLDEDFNEATMPGNGNNNDDDYDDDEGRAVPPPHAPEEEEHSQPTECKMCYHLSPRRHFVTEPITSSCNHGLPVICKRCLEQYVHFLISSENRFRVLNMPCPSHPCDGVLARADILRLAGAPAAAAFDAASAARRAATTTGGGRDVTAAHVDGLRRLGLADCPGCGTTVARAQGCHHMVCRACGTHFCHRCGRAYPADRRAAAAAAAGGWRHGPECGGARMRFYEVAGEEAALLAAGAPMALVDLQGAWDVDVEEGLGEDLEELELELGREEAALRVNWETDGEGEEEADEGEPMEVDSPGWQRGERPENTIRFDGDVLWFAENRDADADWQMVRDRVEVEDEEWVENAEDGDDEDGVARDFDPEGRRVEALFADPEGGARARDEVAAVATLWVLRDLANPRRAGEVPPADWEVYNLGIRWETPEDWYYSFEVPIIHETRIYVHNQVFREQLVGLLGS